MCAWQVYRHNSLINGQEKWATLQKGDVLGEMSLVTGCLRTASAVAKGFVDLHVSLHLSFLRICSACHVGCCTVFSRVA